MEQINESVDMKTNIDEVVKMLKRRYKNKLDYYAEYYSELYVSLLGLERGKEKEDMKQLYIDNFLEQYGQ